LPAVAVDSVVTRRSATTSVGVLFGSRIDVSEPNSPPPPPMSDAVPASSTCFSDPRMF
jgi:hypothetical protein